MNKLKKTIERIQPIDSSLIEKTQKRLDNLTKPQGSLGMLEELAKRVVGITRNENPVIKNKVIFTLVSDTGVAQEKVSAYPREVTTQMVLNFINGGAGINVLAKHVGAKVIVVDIGVASDIKPHPKLINKKINYGTKNMAKGPAMTKEEAIKSIETGIELVEEELKNGIDIVGTGEMGIGNTTSSSAIVAAVTKEPIEKITGRGTGINDDTLKNKINVIKKALQINKLDSEDPIDVLSKVGGFEIGGIAGIMLGAAANRIPIATDGFIPAAGTLIAVGLEPKIKDYIIAPHNSAEIGDKVVLNYLGQKPLFDLDLRLGEGTGAALGISLVEAAVKILTQMASFEEAGVSKRND